MKKQYKKIRKTIKGAIKAYINLFAPYVVVNAKTNGVHYAWSRKEAISWMACYNPRKMGKTSLFNFWDKEIAATF